MLVDLMVQIVEVNQKNPEDLKLKSNKVLIVKIPLIRKRTEIMKEKNPNHLKVKEVRKDHLDLKEEKVVNQLKQKDLTSVV